jgi:hypothetical protein
MARTFSQGNMLTYMPMIQGKIGQTMERLKEESKGGCEEVDLYKWVHWFALDVVCMKSQSNILFSGSHQYANC